MCPTTRTGDDSPSQVHLVTVVFRGIVRGRHHHPGISVILAHRVGQQGGGANMGHQQGFSTGCRNHSRRRAGEVGRTMPSVETNHHQEVIPDGCSQGRGQPPSGAANHRRVHPGWSGPHFPAQTGGAERDF